MLYLSAISVSVFVTLRILIAQREYGSSNSVSQSVSQSVDDLGNS